MPNANGEVGDCSSNGLITAPYSQFETSVNQRAETADPTNSQALHCPLLVDDASRALQVRVNSADSSADDNYLSREYCRTGVGRDMDENLSSAVDEQASDDVNGSCDYRTAAFASRPDSAPSEVSSPDQSCAYQAAVCVSPMLQVHGTPQPLVLNSDDDSHAQLSTSVQQKNR